MKPQGRKKIKFPSKTDCHPKSWFQRFGERVVNWWEAENEPSPKAERHKIKQDLKLNQ